MSTTAPSIAIRHLEPFPQAAAWAALVQYVKRHGRPAGVIKHVGPPKWAQRLGVGTEAIAGAINKAQRRGALRLRDDGKLEIPSLMAEVSASTRRVRRHRRRHHRREVAEGQPWWTISDARRVARVMCPQGRRPPVGLAPAVLEAADLLYDELRDTEPIQTLREWAEVYAEKHAGTEAPLSPVDWLSSAVSDQIGRRVALAERPRSR